MFTVDRGHILFGSAASAINIICIGTYVIGPRLFPYYRGIQWWEGGLYVIESQDEIGLLFNSRLREMVVKSMG